MPRGYRLISRLLCIVLVPGCLVDSSGSDTQSAGTTATTSTSGSSLSGSATSAPDTASDSAPSDSAPTMATTSLTGTVASSSEGETCQSSPCEDMMNGSDECNPWAQDCPEGQKCAAIISGGGSSWDTARCVDVTGTDKPGDPCTMEDVASGVDSCIKGAMCWDVNAEGVGYCVAQCTGDPETPICDDKSSCTIYNDGVVLLCFPICDPLLQDCPGSGNACYPINDYFACSPDVSGEEGQANDPCEFINLCDPGLMCADPALVGLGCPEGSMSCCTPFCKFPDGACPNLDQQCLQYFDPMTLPSNDPWLDIGVCGVPG
jgi:hypothetical protein